MSVISKMYNVSMLAINILKEGMQNAEGKTGVRTVTKIKTNRGYKRCDQQQHTKNNKYIRTIRKVTRVRSIRCSLICYCHFQVGCTFME